jgi:hypothetical protein
MNDLQTAIEQGTKAWADVPDATKWVEELRGNDTPEVTPDVDKACTKVGTNSGVLHKEWVGLTDHELQVLDFNDPERGKLARAVEAKLKERNI